MTTQTKHTPGPWRLKEGPFKNWVVIQTQHGEQICETTVYNDEHTANAALIAQAPDLLRQRDKLREALKDLEAIASLANARQHAGCDVRPDDWSEINHCCNQARAILAETEAA